MLKGHKWWIVLVWVTVLVFVVVSKLDNSIKNLSTLNLGPITSTIPVQVSNDPTASTEYVIPMGNNTVWVIHPTQNQVTIITRSSDGTIQAKSQSYSH